MTVAAAKTNRVATTADYVRIATQIVRVITWRGIAANGDIEPNTNIIRTVPDRTVPVTIVGKVFTNDELC
jgi:hypothetical protein